MKEADECHYKAQLAEAAVAGAADMWYQAMQKEEECIRQTSEILDELIKSSRRNLRRLNKALRNTQKLTGGK